MANDNPRVIKWSNEILRRMAEDTRDFEFRVRAFQREYSNISDVLVNNGTSIEDGRVEDSDLIGTDAVNFAAQINAIAAVFDGPGVMDVITKPTVRRLRIGRE